MWYYPLVSVSFREMDLNDPIKVVWLEELFCLFSGKWKPITLFSQGGFLSFSIEFGEFALKNMKKLICHLMIS